MILGDGRQSDGRTGAIVTFNRTSNNIIRAVDIPRVAPSAAFGAFTLIGILNVTVRGLPVDVVSTLEGSDSHKGFLPTCGIDVPKGYSTVVLNDSELAVEVSSHLNKLEDELVKAKSTRVPLDAGNGVGRSRHANEGEYDNENSSD